MITMTVEELLDMLTTAALIGGDEIKNVQTRGDMTEVVQRRLRKQIAAVTS